MNHRGFSILIAISTIGILFIVVVGLASTYIRELKLSRASYDVVLSSASAEGMFEYGMLKIRNHREGFEDAVSLDTSDGRDNFTHTTDRSKNLRAEYTIRASSKKESFTLPSGEHLIVPLFTAQKTLIDGSSASPMVQTGVITTTGLTVTGIGSHTGTLVGTIAGETVGLSWVGDIDTATAGTIRKQYFQCFDSSGNDVDCSLPGVVEKIPYFADDTKKISDFLTEATDVYFLLYNSHTDPLILEFNSTAPFALPNPTIEARATKNQSSQVFQYTDDRGRYYDALKYGVYNQ